MWAKLIYKELLLIGRAKNGILSMLVLVLSMIFIFHYSLEKNGKLDEISLIGLKWAIVFIVSFVLISQSNWEERESGAFRINKAHLSPGLIFLGKSLAVFAIQIFVELFIILLFSIFFEKFELSIENLKGNLIFLFPSTLSLSFLGIALGGLTHSTRLKEILLPVLLIPLSLPVMLFGMEAERKFLWDKKDFIFSMALIISLAVFYGALGIFIQEVFNED